MTAHDEHSPPGVSFHHHHGERRDRAIGRLLKIGAQWLVNWPISALRWISFRRRRGTTARQLQYLNDHYLKDIGLERAQVASSVDEIIDAGAWSADRTARRQRWGL